MKTRLLSLVVLLCMSLGTAHGMIPKAAAMKMAESQGKMEAYITMTKFHYSQICIKHEAASLTPIGVEYMGNIYKLEDVADIVFPEGENDYDKIYVHPKDNIYLACIIDGIYSVHPEFKVDIYSEIDEDDDERHAKERVHEENFEEIMSKNKEELEKDDKRYIIRLTMPPVNKKRRDFCHEQVKQIFNYTKVKLDKEKVLMKANVAPKIIGLSDRELDEVNKAMDKIYDTCLKLAEDMRNDKDDEIEMAYNRYVEINGEEDDTPDNSEEIIIENVVIEDGKVFYTTEDVIALNLTFKRNFTKDALCAFSVPFSFKASDVAGKFYDFGNYNEKDSTLTLVPHDGAIEAGKGYFFLPEEDITQMVFENALVIATPTPPLPIETGIYGALTGLSFLEESYVLQTAANGASKLTKAQKDTRLAPYQSYLWISDMPDASEITIRLSDEALNVDGSKATPSKATSLIYNLRGQRIATPSRGELYIKNGKKYMMR